MCIISGLEDNVSRTARVIFFVYFTHCMVIQQNNNISSDDLVVLIIIVIFQWVVCHLVGVFIQIYYIFWNINLITYDEIIGYMVQATPESLNVSIQGCQTYQWGSRWYTYYLQIVGIKQVYLQNTDSWYNYAIILQVQYGCLPTKL